MANLDMRKRFFFGMKQYDQKLSFTRLYGDSREGNDAKATRARNFNDVFLYMKTHPKIATPHMLGQYLGCLGASAQAMTNISRWYRDYTWLQTAYHETFEDMGGVTNCPPLANDVHNVWSPTADRPGASINHRSVEYSFQLGWDRAVLLATTHISDTWYRVGWHSYYNGLDGMVAVYVFEKACGQDIVGSTTALNGYLAAQQSRLQNFELL